MVKETPFDAWPSGLATVTLASPAVVRSLAGIAAVSCVSLTKVVGRGLPFHSTVAPGAKLLPVTVRVKAGAPTGAAAGASDVTVGRVSLVRVPMARLWPCPLAMALTPLSPTTCTGTELPIDPGGAVVPLPSWPSAFRPQAHAVPSPLSARLW